MESRPKELIIEALALHRRGALAEAAERYAAVLQVEPHYADAHYYLGLIACQQGRFAEGAERARAALIADLTHARAQVLLGRALAGLRRNEEALASFDRALALEPELAQAYGHRGDVLSELGRYGEAVQDYDRALAAAPDRAADWFNRGTALAALARHAEAAESFERVIALRPADAQAHLRRANSLSEAHRYSMALEAIDRALASAPGLAEAWLGRGNVLHALGRCEDALAAHDKALEIKPDLAGAYLGRGNVLRDLMRYDEALLAYSRALALAPDLAAAWLGRGNVYFEVQQRNFGLKQYDEASAAYERALKLQSNLAAAWLGRGNVLRELNRHDEALAAYDKALAHDPGFADAWFGRGNVLYSAKRDEGAIAAFDKAIALNKDLAQAYYGKALAKLMLGEYEEGWRLYEWRWLSRLFTARQRHFPRPLWLGNDALDERTILIHAEQGLGDTIQFCRYLGSLRKLNCTIIFEAQTALVSLLRERKQDVQVIGAGDPLPDFDVHCPLLSLPLALRTTLQTIPATVPYLFVSEAKRAKWRELLGERHKPRIGVAWSGNLHPDPGRSVPFTMLAPLLSDSCEWHSLQKETRKSDTDALNNSRLIRDHSQRLANFSDTAELVAEMDLVISIDTAVAHLAGALGKPVWIMLPFQADFRWLRDRADCPWYPTARLFRQNAPGDWTGPISHVVVELQKFCTLQGEQHLPDRSAHLDELRRSPESH